MDDDLALHSSVSSFKDGLLNFVPTLAPLVLESNSTTTVSLAPVSSAFKDVYDDLAVTLNPWEIVKLLWNSVDTPVAVGAAFFVSRYY